MVDFPNTPVDGQQHSEAGVTWVWKAGAGLWAVAPVEEELDARYLRLTGGVLTGTLHIQSSITYFGVDGQGQLRSQAKTAPMQLRTQQTDQAAATQFNFMNSSGSVIASVAPNDTVSQNGYTLMTRNKADNRYLRMTGDTMEGALQVHDNLTLLSESSQSYIYLRGTTGGANTGSIYYTDASQTLIISAADSTNNGRRWYHFHPSTIPLAGNSVLRRADADDRYLQDAPSDGEQYVRKDGEWAIVEGGASVSTGSSFPVSPDAGDLHYLTVAPVGLYTYYDDGNSIQWVQTNGAGGGSEGSSPSAREELKVTGQPGSNTTGTFTVPADAVELIIEAWGPGGGGLGGGSVGYGGSGGSYYRLKVPAYLCKSSFTYSVGQNNSSSTACTPTTVENPIDHTKGFEPRFIGSDVPISATQGVYFRTSNTDAATGPDPAEGFGSFYQEQGGACGTTQTQTGTARTYAGAGGSSDNGGGGTIAGAVSTYGGDGGPSRGGAAPLSAGVAPGGGSGSSEGGGAENGGAGQLIITVIAG